MPASLIPNPLTLNPGSDADGVGMAALISRIFDDYENCPFVMDEFPELHAPATYYGDKGGKIWVLSDMTKQGDDRVTGSIAITPTHLPGVAELFKVYLAHERRGSGVAQTLLATAMEWARTANMHALILWTDTRFVSGHRFYEKHGFVRMPGVRALHDAAETFEFGYQLQLPQPVTP